VPLLLTVDEVVRAVVETRAADDGTSCYEDGSPAAFSSIRLQPESWFDCGSSARNPRRPVTQVIPPRDTYRAIDSALGLHAERFEPCQCVTARFTK